MVNGNWQVSFSYFINSRDVMRCGDDVISGRRTGGVEGGWGGMTDGSAGRMLNSDT